MRATNRILWLLITLLLLFSTAVIPAELRIIDAKKGDDYGQQFGDKVEGLGDINGDGYGDFLVTEFTARKLHLYLGGPAPFSNPPALTWENHGDVESMASFSPVNVGDVDGDSITDFITTIHEDDTVKIFLGLESLDPDDCKVLFADTNDHWKYRMSGGGDNNNDGRPDFWLYHYYFSTNDTIWGYWGGDLFDTIPDMKIIRSREPDNKYRTLGYEFCTDCDLNGDSIPEIIYGQPTSYSDCPGRVCIIWGSDNPSEEPDLVINPPYVHDGNCQFGIDFACLKDISGDGIDDIWISQGGRNYIYFGGQPFDTIPDIGLDWSYLGLDPIENIGDINDDGYNDIMLSSGEFLVSYISFIYCYPGMDTLIDAFWIDGDYQAILANGPLCCAGLDHSRLGDVDGDGIDDVLLAPRETDIDHIDHGWAVIQAGWQEPVATDFEPTSTIPNELELKQNWPNPFNSGTIIEFTLPRSGYTEITIFNILGEVVATPLSEILSAGEHQIHWDGRDSNGHPTATGMYFYRITSGDFSETKKMVLLK